jgi:hypothetical protein
VEPHHRDINDQTLLTTHTPSSPMKMEPTEGSETSAALKLTPGIYLKEDIQHSKPDESLKSRRMTDALHEDLCTFMIISRSLE